MTGSRSRRVDAIIVVAAMLGLIAFAPAIRSFELRHLKAFAALLVAIISFGVVLYDTSVQIERLEWQRWRRLKLPSSP